MSSDHVESLEAFKNSFSYGPRNDLNFKFLKSLTADEAAQFFQELLWKLGDTYDDGDASRLIDHAYQWQVRAYQGAGRWTYDDGPFTPLSKPLSQSRLLLLTSSGHFVDGDDPRPFGVEEMTQEEAIIRVSEFLREAPDLSAIPIDTPRKKLRVRHPGYDIRGSQADPNVTLPIEPLRLLARGGLIGEFAPTAYSFVGAAAQTPLQKEKAPQWAQMFQDQEIDAVLLVPA